MSEALSLEQGIRIARPVATGQSLQSMAWRQLWRKRTALAGLAIISMLIQHTLTRTVHVAAHKPTHVMFLWAA